MNVGMSIRCTLFNETITNTEIAGEATKVNDRAYDFETTVHSVVTWLGHFVLLRMPNGEGYYCRVTGIRLRDKLYILSLVD